MSAKKILFISPIPPWPADSGGAQRSHLLYQALKRLGEVDLVLLTTAEISSDALSIMRDEFGLKAILHPEPGGLSLRRLDFGYGRIGVNVHRLTRWILRSRITLFHSEPAAKKMRELIRTGGYDLAVGRYLWTVVQTGLLDELPTFVDFDDLESEVWLSRAEESSGKMLQAYYGHIANSYFSRQRKLAKRVDGGWVAKPRDAACLGRPDLAVLPNIPFSSYPNPAEPLTYTGHGELNVVGVAAFDYRPNLLGFNWFVTQVWPQLVQRYPQARLHLIGKLNDEGMKERWSAEPGVVLHGRVPELRPFYEQALFAVAPIFLGGGTNIKVVEALAFGRCCVGTPHSLKGFEGLQGVWQGRDRDDFAEHCLSLLACPESTLNQGREAAGAIGAYFSFERFATEVQAALTTSVLRREKDPH